MIEEGYNIKRIMGNNLLVRRFEMPEEGKDSGLLTAKSITNKNEDVHMSRMIRPLYQNRGEIIGIGAEVPEGKYELGEVVHFQPHSFRLVYLDKTDADAWTQDPTQMFAKTPYVLVDSHHGIDYVEEYEL